MIILLAYFFDKGNYTQSDTCTEDVCTGAECTQNNCTKFDDMLNHSLESEQVRALLKVYSVLTDNEKDKNIIAEILQGKD